MKPMLTIAAIGLCVLTGCSARPSASIDPGYTGEGKSRGVVPPVAPNAGEHWYACVAGDTITGVAKKHQMTVPEVIERNNLKDSPSLAVGQRLVVRGAAPAP